MPFTGARVPTDRGLTSLHLQSRSCRQHLLALVFLLIWMFQVYISSPGPAINIYCTSRGAWAGDTIEAALVISVSYQVLLSEHHNGVRHYEEPWSMSRDHDEEFPMDNGKNLRETAQKLYAKLQETEKRHQADRRLYEERLNHCQQEVEQNNRARKQAEETSTERQREVEELRRLMSSMEKEHQDLLNKMQENEKELDGLRGQKEENGSLKNKCQDLEKTVTNLKEKIHHLDDMLKSQQRKVRQMIEQLQNSRTANQEKDSLIQELREKVSWLQSENLELHDKLEHFLSTQQGHTTQPPRALARPNIQNFKRVYLPAGAGRPQPLIKLVET